MLMLKYFVYFIVLIHTSVAFNVLQLDDKNFEEIVISSGKLTLVDFYADWCRHCKNFEPTYLELADKYEDFEDIQITKINGDKNGSKTSKKYNIQGYPTILFFNGNKDPVEFDGIRDLQSLSNFVQQLSGVRLDKGKKEASVTPNKIQIINDGNFESTVQGKAMKTVLIFSTQDQDSNTSLDSLLDKLANVIYVNDDYKVQFGKVDTDSTSAGLRSRFNINNDPHILIYERTNEGEQIVSTYNEGTEMEKLIEFVNSKAGVHRDSKGKLLPSGGKIRLLDEVVRQTITSGKFNARIQLFKNLQELEGKLKIKDEKTSGQITFSDDISMAFYYTKVAETLINSGIEGIQFERTRLKNRLKWEKHILEDKTIDSMLKRINIINTFT